MTDVWMAFGVAAIVAFLFTPAFRALSNRLDLLDRPNERSSHVHPTPRSGGMAVVLGIAASVLLSGTVSTPGVRTIATGALLIACLGVVDDIVNLRQWPKFTIHIMIAIGVILVAGLGLSSVDLPFLSVQLWTPVGAVFGVVWAIWMINAYNFMDGVNGMAGFGAVVGGAGLCLLFLRVGDTPGALLSAAIAGGGAGFLPWNFPRASIFMGDVGSTTLGFLFALLVLRLCSEGVPLAMALLPLAVFLFDTVLTVVIRMMRGERFFSTPHKLHLYQRLLRLGWSHAGVTLLYAALGSLCIAAALAYDAAAESTRLLILVLILITLSIFARVVIVRWAGVVNPSEGGRSALDPAPR